MIDQGKIEGFRNFFLEGFDGFIFELHHHVASKANEMVMMGARGMNLKHGAAIRKLLLVCQAGFF